MNRDFTLSPETQAIYDALLTVPVGGEISYADLSEAAGLDVTGLARSNLISARRIALREDGAVFSVIRGSGLHRLRPEEAPEVGAVARKKMRRAAVRSVRTLNRMTFGANNLPSEVARRVNAEIATSSLIAHLTRDQATKEMEAEAKPMSSREAGERFLSYLGGKR